MRQGSGGYCLLVVQTKLFDKDSYFSWAYKVLSNVQVGVLSLRICKQERVVEEERKKKQET